MAFTKKHKFHKFDRVKVGDRLATVHEDSWFSGSEPSYRLKFDDERYAENQLIMEDEIELIDSSRLVVLDPQKPQMFTDEFIGEVIQIVAPTRLHIDIKSKKEVGAENVQVVFAGTNLDGFVFATEQHGRSIGEALRRVREELREACGQ